MEIQNLLSLKLYSFGLITLVRSSCFIFPAQISLTWSGLICDTNIEPVRPHSRKDKTGRALHAGNIAINYNGYLQHGATTYTRGDKLLLTRKKDNINLA